MSADPQVLNQYVTLAERGDLATAAAQLHTSPRALMRAVQGLEAELGAPLIVAAGRSLVLTDAGRVVLQSARRALTAFDRLHAQVAGDRTTIRVAHVANSDTLSLVLDALAAGHPEVAVEELTAPDDAQVGALVAHRIDVAVCSAAALEASVLAGVRCAPLRADAFVRLRGSADASAGAGLACADYGAAWPAHDLAVEQLATSAGRPLARIPVPAGSGQETRTLLRNALGRCVVVPQSTCRGRADALPWPTTTIDWHVAWRSDDHSPAVGRLVAAATALAAGCGWRLPPPHPNAAER